MDIAVLGMRIDTSPVKAATRAIESFGVSSKKAATIAGGLVRTLGALGVGVSVGAALNRASVQAGQFGTALAEVSTLIEGTPAQMQKLRQESIKLSNAYGGTATRNTKAFYQAISAGASTVEDAAKIVEQANKLAVGGLTDVFVATDGLTSVMNAYAESGLTAAQASDSMFVAMRMGKTTISELAGSLGRIAPFASAAGVSFDELNAAIAAVTAKGINTNEAVTGLRQALVSITKPSAQATELAGELGLNFNAAALEAQGLEKFMGSLADATGGNVAQLTELLGSAEAANATLALLAGNGEKFSATLQQMTQKVGATDAAVEKMAGTLENRLARAMATIENAGLGPGELWLKLKVGVAEAAADIVTDVQNMVKAVGAAFRGDWKAAWEAAGKDVDLATAGMNVATLGALENIKALVSKENLDAVKGFFGAFWDGITGGGNSDTELARMAPDFDIVRDEYLRMMESMRLATNDMYANWDEATRAAAAVTEEELFGAVEKAKIEFVHIGEIAGGQAWAGIKKAAEAAAELAGNLKEASSYADGTAPGTGNAGDGYSGVKGGGGLSSLGGRTQTIYIAPIIKSKLEKGLFKSIGRFHDALRRSIVDGFEKGFSDVEKFDFGRDILTMSVEPGVTDAFWADFEFKATSSWTSALTAAFEAGGESLLAITDDMLNAMTAGSDKFSIDMTKQMLHVSTRYRTLNSWINNSIDRELDNMIKVNLEVIARGFTGVIHGAKTQVKEFAKALKTIEIERLDGNIITKIQTVTKSKSNKPLDKLITSISKDIINSVDIYADALGVTAKDFSKISHRFKFSFKDGTSPKDIEKMFQAEIDKYSEKLAKAALKGNSAFRNAGETWINAMERMAKDFWGVYNSLKLLDGQRFKNNLQGANFASKLVQQFGDAEAFNTAASSFFDVAYSPDQQQSQIRRYLKGVFRSLRLDPKDLPKTREAYRDLVLSFNLEKKLGRERYSTLVSMSGMFDAILPAFDSATGSTDKYASKLTFATSKLTELISEADAAGRRFDQLASSLADTADIVRGMGQSSTVTFDILERRFASLYQKGLTGDADAMDQIRDVARSYATAYGSRATSSAEYAFITATIGNKLDQLSDVAAAEADMSYYESESLQALKDSIANGKITNQLIREANEATGGFGNKMLRSLGAIYTAQTGKKLDLGGASAKSKSVSADDTSYKDGDTTAVTSTKSASSASENRILRIERERRRLEKVQIRVARRNARYNKRAMRVLEDFNVNGLPPERSA